MDAGQVGAVSDRPAVIGQQWDSACEAGGRSSLSRLENRRTYWQVQVQLRQRPMLTGL